MSDAATQPILTLNNVSIRFGGLLALQDISFSVKANEILAIIGPNGAGKTTLFNISTGVYQETVGSISIFGQSPDQKFDLSSATWLIIMAALGACSFFCAYNIESLWSALITEHYVYEQPFAWADIPSHFLSYLSSLGWGSSYGSLFFGALISSASYLALWKRARRTPESIMAKGLARTFQNIRLFPKMTAIENILVGMHNQHKNSIIKDCAPASANKRRNVTFVAQAKEILDLVKLNDRSDHLAAKLSYGHQRRLEIARALASNPKLILLDEPAAGMNPTESEELMQIIRKIKARGVSVLLIEHHMQVVMGISDRIIVLDYGQKIAEGTPQEITNNATVIEAYLGGEML